MITAELGIGLRAVVFIAVLERVVAPCVPWVLRDRTDPERVHTELVEISLGDLLRDTGEVAALVIHDIQYFRTVHLPVVGSIAVVETVDHQRVEHLGLLVMAVQLCGIRNDLTILHRKQQVVVEVRVILGKDPQIRASL